MTQLTKYLAELVNSQLDNRVVEKIPVGIEFEQLSDIASRNHMTYMIYSALMRSGCLDKDQYAFCQNAVLRSITISSIQMNEYKKWCEECEKKGVVNLPMKGSVMKSFYPNPEMREMSDIDVLIGKDSMDGANEVLIGMGYQLKQAIKHHDIYMKAPIMVVEAHRSMYDKHVDRNQHDYFDGFSKAVLRENCKYTYSFTPEDFYIYMVAHAAKHFYEMGCGIRNLVDIYVYKKKFNGVLDQTYLDREFEYCGLKSFVDHCENLAQIWLENKWESVDGEMSDFYSNLFQYMCDSGIYGKDANGIWNKFADEEAKEATSEHLKRWYYFPPVTYMAKYYPWLEERPFLLPVAWFVRFCRGVFLKKGEKKREMVSDISETEIRKYQQIYQKMNLKFKG